MPFTQEAELPDYSEAVERAVEECAGNLMGAEREPEVRKFLRSVLGALRDSGESVLAYGADLIADVSYFQDVNVVGDRLPPERVDEIIEEEIARSRGSALVPAAAVEFKVRNRARDTFINYLKGRPQNQTDDDGSIVRMARFGRDHGLSEGAILEEIREHLNPLRSNPLTLDDLKNLVGSAFRDIGAPFEMRTVQYRPDRLILVAEEAEAAHLANYDLPSVYNFCGSLVEIVTEEVATLRGFLTGQVTTRLMPVSSTRLRERLMRSAKFTTVRGAKIFPDKVLDDVVQTIQGWGPKKAPTLRGLINAPTILRGAASSVSIEDAPWQPRTPTRIIQYPGYDHNTGLYATFSTSEFSRVREDLSRSEMREHALRGYAWLRDQFFRDFEFAGQLDADAAVSMLLTGVCSRTCGNRPGYLLSAGMRGSGKTTLADMVTMAVDGVVADPLPWGKEEEIEKLLLAKLKTGAQTLCFDNIKQGTRVDSPGLARLITGETFSGRILGESNTVTVSSDVLLILTANNAVLEGDSPTRIIEIRLEPKTDRPDQRSFSRPNPIEWVRQNRSKANEAAISIIRYGLEVPPTNARPSRFAPDWDAMVRFPLMAAGGGDVALKFDAAFRADPMLAALRDLFEAWAPFVGPGAVTSAQIIRRLEGEISENQTRFHTALNSALNLRQNVYPSAQTLGQKFAQITGQGVAGKRLVKSENRDGVQCWAVQAI